MGPDGNSYTLYSAEVDLAILTSENVERQLGGVGERRERP
jgi:hypothetical protein